jgi:hypothetical protein
VPKRLAQRPRSLGDPQCGGGRLEGRGRVAHSMLEPLRYLDPGSRGKGPTADREVAPCRQRLIVTAESSEEAGPLDEHVVTRGGGG